MSLAAKIRDYDPKNNRSVDVAAELETSSDYVRAVWQRMTPKKQASEMKYRTENKAYITALARKRFRRRYRTDSVFRRKYLEKTKAYKYVKYHNDANYRARYLADQRDRRKRNSNA